MPSAPAESILEASSNDAAAAFNSVEDQFSRQRITDASINVGRQGTAGLFHQAMVIPFQLPDFGAVAEPFVNAEFSVRLNEKPNNPLWNVDLYGLAPRVASAVLPSSAGNDPGDFFMGGFQGGPANDTTVGVVKIQDNLITSSTPTGNTVTTDSTGNAALAAYLNTAYDNGAGAGRWVFLRLSGDATPGGVSRYAFSSANHSTAANRPAIRYNFDVAPPRARPFIWVTADERDDILEKIANHPWAQSNLNWLASRNAGAIAAHQADRDGYIRGLPVDWSLTPARYRTTATNGGATYTSIRSSTEGRFNAALDAAVLFYLTGEPEYAELAGDILHNVARTLMVATPSANANNGGLIIQNDFLLESRLVGTQMPVIYDFLFDYLEPVPEPASL